MKREEALAKLYLHSLGISKIVHEPDGNVTPDFVVDGRIAVEVRRLNQHKITTQGKPIALENLQFALARSTREVLRSLGPSKNGRSWLVHYKFSRDLQPLPQLKSEIRKALADFREIQPKRTELRISDHFKVVLMPASRPYPYRFVPGGFSDRDTTGWTSHQLQTNIQICIQEKTAKIAKVRARYPEWWLILIDQIGFGERESVNIRHDWNKVIVINPLNPTSGYEL